MSTHIMSPLASRLDGAYRLLQTLVLRSKSGEVYKIEVGESLFSGCHAYGAIVTLAGELNQHLGVCRGSSIEQVFNAAQERVFADMTDDRLTDDRLTVTAASPYRPAEPVLGSTL